MQQSGDPVAVEDKDGSKDCLGVRLAKRQSSKIESDGLAIEAQIVDGKDFRSRSRRIRRRSAAEIGEPADEGGVENDVHMSAVLPHPLEHRAGLRIQGTIDRTRSLGGIDLAAVEGQPSLSGALGEFVRFSIFADILR